MPIYGHDRKRSEIRSFPDPGPEARGRGLMRNRTAIAALAGVGLALGYVSAADAHHAVNAQFDVTKSVVITGTLVKVDWQNPHAWFWFDVKKPDGTTERWGTETVGPNGLRRIGLSDRSEEHTSELQPRLPS